VKTVHKTNGYGQLKYVISEILPEYVDKVIFLDSDMLVLEDISVLHSYCNVMQTRGIMFAATGDQYKRDDLERSFGRGASRRAINSGLVLYNLAAMRRGVHTMFCSSQVFSSISCFRKYNTYQDVFTAVAILRPETYLKLQCFYNFQIGSVSFVHFL
ncbi:hypothetical protein PMAYCL1PPCAC_10340, partial [Pristionchus mayeri]